MKPPGGEHRRPPTLGGPANLGSMSFLGRSLIFMGFLWRSGRVWLFWYSGQKSRKNLPQNPLLSLEVSNSTPGSSKIEAWRLQNRGLRPPKSSPEPSKTPFLKTFNLGSLKSKLPYRRRGHFEPTWLQVGGPRPSKIEAETRKNRC